MLPMLAQQGTNWDTSAVLLLALQNMNCLFGDEITREYCIAYVACKDVASCCEMLRVYKFIKTLTEFNWIGIKSIELRYCDKNGVFACEKAVEIGVGGFIKDKDGAALFATIQRLRNNKKYSATAAIFQLLGCVTSRRVMTGLNPTKMLCFL
ncbi:hypothetical protein CCR75_007099 [Bremia lactucae]|uniref:Uncharacterized protein n=1 Tax=Bremia lactucae TaxID=4779 RepID=A0A976FRB5_BRELC|nr:hypothetical protein CCR75_007099 [Bremia lactucae]